MAYPLDISQAILLLSGANGLGPEAKSVAKDLGDFDYTKCPQWLYLQSKFSTGVSLKELKSIATIIQLHLGLPPLTRNQKRSYPLLIKWFCINWDQIQPVLQYIYLFDDNLMEISSNSQISSLILPKK